MSIDLIRSTWRDAEKVFRRASPRAGPAAAKIAMCDGQRFQVLETAQHAT